MAGSHPSRWAIFSTGLLVQLAAGTGYAFGIYSRALKRKDGLGFSQSQVDAIATMGNLGLFTSVIGGLFFGRFGPRWTLFGGGLMSGFGFMMLSLSIGGHLGHVHFLVVGLFSFLSQHGSAWMGAPMIAVCVQNFPPKDRGKIVGLMKAFFGLGSAFISEIYAGVFSPDENALVSFLAIVVPVIVWASVPLACFLPTSLRSTYARDHNTNPSFSPYAIVTTAIALTVTSAVLIQNVLFCVGGKTSDCVPPTTPRVLFLIACVVVLGLIMLLPRMYGPVVIGTTSSSSDPLIANYDTSQEVLVQKPPPGLTLWQSIKTIRMWLLFLALLTSSGSGLIVINNMAQITQSLVGEGKSYLGLKTVLVAVLGCFNCGGRLVAGFLTDKFVHKIPRTLFLTIWITIMALSMVLLTLAESVGVLFVAVPLTGFSYGLVFSTAASLVADLFGPQHFAAIYGMVDFAPAIGSFVFATHIAGSVYDHHAHEVGGEEVCFGRACYHTTFLIATAASLTGVACSLLLWLNTRHMANR